MTKEQLKRALLPSLLLMTRGQRAALARKKVRMRYPLRAERSMAVVISRLYGVYTKKVISFLTVKRPLYSVYEDRLHNDSFESEFSLYIRELIDEIGREAPIGLLNGISATEYVGRVLEYVKSFDEKEVEAYFLKTFKIGLPYSDTWWDGLRQQLVAEFATRASSTITDYLGKVQDIALEGIRNEMPFDQLVEQIQKASEGMTTKRANFLARDLTGKVNSLFTRNLHKAVGISNYLWTSAFDERVRGRPGGVYADAPVDHWSMDNKIGSWNDPTVYSADLGRTFVPKIGNMVRYHPGMDWACRCVASPWLQDLVVEIDAEIRGGYYGAN